MTADRSTPSGRLPRSIDTFNDTVLGCGLFHILEDQDRPAFIDGLARVARPGDRYHLLCLSDRQPRRRGPRPISESDIRTCFAPNWTIDSIVIDLTIEPAGARAWQARMTRK